MKTIREISESTGISKVSLYKLIKKPELKDYIKKEGNYTLVDDIGEQIILEYYSRQKLITLNDILDEINEKHEKSKETEKDCSYKINEDKNTDIMRILESQMYSKDEQIKEKNSQIKIKDEQIRQKDNQINALLTMLSNEITVKLISNSIAIPDKQGISPETKGFFKRIFNKK